MRTRTHARTKENRHIISQEDEEQLMRILGDNEPNPSNPQKYKSYDEIKNDSNFKNYGQQTD